MENRFNFILITVLFFTSFIGVNYVNAQIVEGTCFDLPNFGWMHPSGSVVTGPFYDTAAACSAANSGSTGVNLDNSDATSGSAVAGSGKSIKLANPLGTVNTIPDFVKAVLDIVMKVGVPLVALAIIYTGYLFIAAQGKPEELTKAKQALVYVFIGSMILLGAYVIAEAIIGTVNNIRGK